MPTKNAINIQNKFSLIETSGSSHDYNNTYEKCKINIKITVTIDVEASSSSSVASSIA